MGVMTATDRVSRSYGLRIRQTALVMAFWLVTGTGWQCFGDEPAGGPAAKDAPAAKADETGEARGPDGYPLVNNVFFDTELRQALSDVASDTGATLVPDLTVQGYVTLELVDAPLERALDLLLLGGGFIWEKMESGAYLITSIDPKSPNFLRIAKQSVIALHELTTKELSTLLPEAFASFVKYDDERRRVLILAPQRIVDEITGLIGLLDRPAEEVEEARVFRSVPLARSDAKYVIGMLPKKWLQYVRIDEANQRIFVVAPPLEVDAIEAHVRDLDAPKTTITVINLEKMTGAELQAILPASMQAQVKVDPTNHRAVIEAPTELAGQIAKQIQDLDSSAGKRVVEVKAIDLDYLDGAAVLEVLPEEFKAFVKAGKTGNEAVIMAEPAKVAQIADYIAAIDLPPTQVMIEALVIESSAGALKNWRPEVQSDNVGVNPLTGMMTYVQDAENVLYQLINLVADNQASVKASPRVIAQEGKEAEVRVGVEQYFRIVTARQNYDYVELQAIEAAIGLKITPRVAAADRVVTCTIMPEVSDATATTADNLPIITKRTATTTVRVADGQIIAIGGLLEEAERIEKSKIPILGDLPLLGPLFRSERKEKSNREVTIFVVPHILNEDGTFEGQLILDRFQPPAAAPEAQPDAGSPDTRRSSRPVHRPDFRH